MRCFLIFIAVFTFLIVCKVDGQKITSSSDEVISMHLSQNTNTDRLQIDYFITGSFGGFRDFIRIDPEIWNYEIPISYKGKSVETLKLIVFSPNYQVKTFDFPTLKGQKSNIDLDLKPLDTVPFFGKILLPNQLNAEELQVTVNYIPSWQCEYLQLLDCMLGQMPITSVNLEKDGKFKVKLPDFARDPIIASYEDKGEFAFKVEEKNGKLLFWLNLKNDSKNSSRIQTALSYPTEQVFTPDPKK
jgi:hypothetical protein